METDTTTATANTSFPGLGERLSGLSAVPRAGRALAGHLSGTLEAPSAADPRALAAAAEAAIGPAVQTLDDLLAAWAARLSTTRTTTLAVTLAALTLACWVAAAVWWRTRTDVGQTHRSHRDLRTRSGSAPDAAGKVTVASLRPLRRRRLEEVFRAVAGVQDEVRTSLTDAHGLF